MNDHTIPVQTGPLYTCFDCGGPALIGQNWSQGAQMFLSAGWGASPLDEWGAHIWYLRKQCSCKPLRVVRLGDCIAPLVPASPDGTLHPCDIPQIREALAAIAAAVPQEQWHCDPATSIVYRLVAGQLAPDEAITRLRDLVKAGLEAVPAT